MMTSVTSTSTRVMPWSRRVPGMGRSGVRANLMSLSRACLELVLGKVRSVGIGPDRAIDLAGAGASRRDQLDRARAVRVAALLGRDDEFQLGARRHVEAAVRAVADQVHIVLVVDVDAR